jgi:SAM-dependent methyltransferase
MNPNATIVADLQNAASIADGQFDCFILTQTLGHIADPLAVLKEARRILRPNGTLLLTVPGLATRVSDHNEAPADYWRFTEDSVRLLAGQTFGDDNVSISCYGNVLAAVAGLMGMAMEELTIRQLETLDTRYPVVVAARAVNMPE